MIIKEQPQADIPTDFSILFQLLMTYRIPMLVKDAIIFQRWFENDSYYLCPRCQQVMEYEFIPHCSRCGQCLNWSKYRKVKTTYRGVKRGL